MAATSFRTETRDEHLYNHLELFNMPSSSDYYQDWRGKQPTGNIGKGRRMFSHYRTEPNNEHLYYNIQSINKPSSPATESQAANQTSRDDRRGQQPTGNSETMGRHVSFAMMAVLALVFLAMFASLIARTWVQVAQSGTNGNFLDRYKMTFSSRIRPKVRKSELWLATVLRRIWLILIYTLEMVSQILY